MFGVPDEKVKAECPSLKQKLIEDFRSHPLFKKIDENASNYIYSILQRLEKLKDPRVVERSSKKRDDFLLATSDPKTPKRSAIQQQKVLKRLKSFKDLLAESNTSDEVTALSLATTALDSLKNRISQEESLEAIDIFNLQILKFFGYFSPITRQIFKSLLFGDGSKEKIPIIWRQLIAADQIFQKTSRMTAYPARYHEFLEQVHLEWSEKFKRYQLVLQLANIYNNPPRGIEKWHEKYLRKIAAGFSGLIYHTEWPLKSEGRYVKTEKLIEKCSKFLGSQMLVAPESHSLYRNPANLVFQVLNHIYVHSPGDFLTQHKLETLIKRDVYLKKAIYAHVLLLQGSNLNEAPHLKLLKDLNFMELLTPSMVKEPKHQFHAASQEELPLDAFKIYGISFSASLSFSRYLIDWSCFRFNLRFYLHEPDIDQNQGEKKEYHGLDQAISEVEKLNHNIRSKQIEHNLAEIKHLRAKGLLQDDEALLDYETKPLDFPLAETDRTKIEKILSLIMASFDGGHGEEQEFTDEKKPKKKQEALFVLLNELVSHNSYAWRTLREELLKQPTLDAHLEQIYSARRKVSENEGRPSDGKPHAGMMSEKVFLELMRQGKSFLDDVQAQTIFENELIALETELREYQERLNLVLELEASIETCLLKRRIEREAADEISAYLATLRPIWLERKWTNLANGTYGKFLKELASTSLNIVLDYSFGRIPIEINQGLGKIMAHLTFHDGSSQIMRMFSIAFQDTSDYRAFAFFERLRSSPPDKWPGGSNLSDSLHRHLENAAYEPPEDFLETPRGFKL
ncbi:hypothetical protein O181_021498 [Austropuccinia psidii MF-1]|uniref:Uncharacterized protein n=1 Tax=Austropuccinia psidii MF-1 TaxID=1389203 RepID=A0A9Q3CF12_9BASI|nr:hypothetical protein [Austropuccinia psidii MF-1]